MFFCGHNCTKHRILIFVSGLVVGGVRKKWLTEMNKVSVNTLVFVLKIDNQPIVWVMHKYLDFSYEIVKFYYQNLYAESLAKDWNIFT